MVTLKQLRYFLALTRHRHFGRAAAECAVSQPALSLQIQELERQLGGALVERQPHAMSVTALGAEVEKRARTILSHTQDLMDFARHQGGPLTGGLRLGVIPSLAPYLLPIALPLLQARYPELRLTLREAQTRYLIDDLLDGGLDAVLLSLPVIEPQIATLELFEDPFLLVTPAGDGVGARLAQLAEIEGDTLLLLEDGHCLRDQALAYCSRAEKAGQQYGAASMATIVQMVASGYGTTLLPRIALTVELRGNPPVSVRPFAHPAPSREVALAWRRTSPRHPDFAALGALFVEAASSLLPRQRSKTKPRSKQ